MKLVACRSCGKRELPLGLAACPVCGGSLAARSKYGNRRVKADGATFDSEWEYAVYLRYVERERSGEISALRVHPKYRFIVNNVEVGTYRPDLDCVVTATGEIEVVDAKSPATMGRDYRFCRALMLALFGIKIVEIIKPGSTRIPRVKRR